MNLVLINKDSQYMRFRHEVKQKSQIRHFLGDVSDPIIDQFEKYLGLICGLKQEK